MNAPLQTLPPQLKAAVDQQRFRDLAERSVTGLLIYPLIWWTLILPRLWYAPSEQNFLWLGGLGLLMFCCSAVRYLLLKRFRKRLTQEREEVKNEWEINVGLLLCAGLWGVVTALSLMPTPLAPFSTVLLAATAGLCAGGIASLAISSSAVLVFLGCMLVPSVIVIGLGYSELALEFAGVLFIFWVGMYWVSSLSRQEYHTALVSNLKLEHQTAYLSSLTHLDSLTGLKDRRYFDQLLDTELKRAIRSHCPLSLLLIDVSNSSSAADQPGDNCLKTVAAVLTAQLKRATDEVVRFGREEFAILLPVTEHSEAEQTAQMIHKAIARTPIPSGTSFVCLNPSIGGVSLVPSALTSPRDLLALAEDAVTHARLKGGGVQFASRAKKDLGQARAESI